MWKLRTILIVIASLFLCGCSDTTSADKFTGIQKRLLELKSYKCNAEIKIYTNKNTTRYIVTQYYAFPSKLRVEIKYPEMLEGIVTISNGKDIVLSNPNEAAGKPYYYENISELAGDNTILTEFFGNYIKSEKSRMTINNEKYKLTTEVFGGNSYMNIETLTVNAAGQPEKLEIFDHNNSLRMELKYSEFQINPKLDEKLFDMY